MKTRHTTQGPHSICILSLSAICLLFTPALRADAAPKLDRPDVEVRSLNVSGSIDDDNAVFTLTAELAVHSSDSELQLIAGHVALLDMDLPRKARLERRGESFALLLPRKGTHRVEIKFACRPQEDGDWRIATFAMPQTTVREFTMTADRPDMEIQFPGAVKVEREEADGGKLHVKAFLAAHSQVNVRWKPEVFRLDGELVVSCSAQTVASAHTGALQLKSRLVYQVVQGELTRLRLEVPDRLHITQVDGKDILQWHLETDEEQRQILTVLLNRRHEQHYELTVTAEQVLPPFPAAFVLPSLVPLDVIRTSGFLVVGTDSAVKLLVKRASGLTQIDQDAFPGEGHTFARSAYAYQFANMPYAIEVEASDIVTTLHCEEQLALQQQDQDLVLMAKVDIDVRDAPTREIRLRTDSDWIVAAVSGNSVIDYEVRDRGTMRDITVLLAEEVSGRLLVELQLEHSLPRDATGFHMPTFQVIGAKSERGFLLLGAEQGVHLSGKTSNGLREVQLGSLPTQMANAQLAYRFKSPSWSLDIALEKNTATIYSELLHVLSLGEGVMFGSSVVTYHIGGAPVRTLRLSIPESYDNVEFTGSDIRNWQREEDGFWTVSLQEKVSGDYTLLVTYDLPLPSQGGAIEAGGIACMDVDSETGYIALAGNASFAIEEEVSMTSTMLPVDVRELPEAYTALIHDPVLAAYKYVQTPHDLELNLERYETRQLLDHINDHTTLETMLSKEGEAVTKVVYFVKNASQQYLEIALPENTDLWTTQVDKKDVQALELPNKERHLLIPIPRHHNPNTFSRVEVVYAQSRKRLGLSRTLSFTAPVTTAQSISSEWTVKFPDTFTGAETSASGPTQGGFTALMRTAGKASVAFIIKDTAWLLFAMISFGFLCLLAYLRGRDLMWSAGTMLTIVSWVALFVIARGLDGRVDALHAMGSSTLFAPAAQQITITNPVQIADEQLGVVVHVAKTWIGAHGSLLFLSVFLVAGLVVFAVGRARRSRLLRATALALVAVAASQISAMQPLVVLALVAVIGHRLFRDGIKTCHRLGVEHDPDLAPPDLPGDVRPAFAGGPDGDPTQGAASIRLVLSMCALCLAAGTGVALGKERVAAQPAPVDPPVAVIIEPAPEPPPPAMQVVRMHIDVSAEDERLDQIATVQSHLEFTVKRRTRIPLLSTEFVFTGLDLPSKYLRMHTDENRHYLDVLKAGTYTVDLQHVAAVHRCDGYDAVRVFLPPNIRNEVTLTLPETGQQVRSHEAVFLTTEEKEEKTSVTVAFGAAETALLTWRPKERETELEQASFSCEQHTLATFDSGLVSMSHFIRYQIAQGEVQSLKLSIPAGASVISLQADSLSTWRFDPETRQVEALLSKPVHGEFQLTLVTQVPREGLPYQVGLHVPSIVGAIHQRGSLGLAVPDAVQVTVDDVTGLTGMNLGDFNRSLASFGDATPTKTQMKRAYRYHQMPLSIQVSAEKVLPEIKVVEGSQFDLTDERMALSSRLVLTIAKSGIFSTQLILPPGYDVESLTGEGVSHWDELETEGNRVVIHFAKQLLGETTINLVLSKPVRTIPQQFNAPRIVIDGATRHTGTMAVSAERGVQLATHQKEGVSEIHPRDLGIQQAGYLAYRLLRSDWQVSLKSEVQAAVVKADILQRVDLSDGVLQSHCYIQYRIHHAGKKSFLLQTPRPGLTLTVNGQNVAKVAEVDQDQGLWRIDLKDKVDDRYQLEVNYQEQVDPTSTEVSIVPLRLQGVDSQKGYLALFAGNRLRVQPISGMSDLRAEDPRGIPALFQAGDLSDAIYCYRTSGADYALGLSVIRHESADVLPATVEAVRLVSVLSEDQHLVTRASMDLVAGFKRQLQMRLPENSTLWTLFVNGKPVRPLVVDDSYLIPLEGADDGASTQIEFIYAGEAEGGWPGRKKTLQGPIFELPLANITWNLYVPTGPRYHSFGGTLNHRGQLLADSLTQFDATRYASSSETLTRGNLDKAAEELRRGEELARLGRQRQARQAFDNAMNWSAGQEDFNEDARVQYNDVAAKQAIVGLVNRRSELKKSHNVQDESNEALAQAPAFDFAGNYNVNYGQLVEQSLTSKDNAALNQVACKLIEQQSSAAEAPAPIQVTMPTQGHELRFYRDLQVETFAPMSIDLRIAGNRSTWLLPLIGFAVLIGLLFVCGTPRYEEELAA